MAEYVRLRVIGITYNKVDRGVYALILQEVGGTRRMPIVIGMSEAQSIECRLQEIITPRPLTHDLMVSIMRAFGLQLNSVVIKQLDGGIFAADLHLTDGERKVTLDARSSDAIAIALRMGVSVYTTEALLAKVSFTPGSTKNSPSGNEVKSSGTVYVSATDEQSLWEKVPNMTAEEQEALMEKFVQNEEYEKAARLKKLIKEANKSDDATDC